MDKIAAIRYLRTHYGLSFHHGLSFKEAREIVEPHDGLRKIPDFVVLMNARAFAESKGSRSRKLNDSAVLSRYGCA